MCGIAGIFLSEGQETPSKVLLNMLVQKIHHRGPDAQHVLAQPGLGLAHARLSIIDPKPASDQPMIDQDNGNSLVFNGEIYNYLELKTELASLGYHFATASDTEVILKAYAHWGVSCLQHFNGMWAFALYDKRRNSLFAARDRLGIKPFVYGITANHDLVFASEAKALVSTFLELSAVNMPFLVNFIERDFFACFKETFYEHLYNLLPGHYMVVAQGEEPLQKRYWDWVPQPLDSMYSEKDIVEQFSALLRDSIQLRFRSDVPVGACLSGGVDSGTLVGFATEMFQKPIPTFSCIYPNSPQFDESQFIQSSAKKFNTVAYYTEPKQDDFLQLIRDSVYEQDGPTGGPSVLSQRAVMALVGQHVKVVLDGQGADELLGGYHGYFRHSLQTLFRALRNQPSRANWKAYRDHAKQVKQRIGHQFLGVPIMWYLTRDPVQFNTPHWEETPLRYLSEFAGDDLNTLLLEHVFTNLTNLLHYEDRNSMRFSVESRLPYLDYRLVEFAFSLNHHYKIRGNTTKWLLYEVAKTVLPEDVLTRKDKMGFTTPASMWLCQKANLAFFEHYFKKDNVLMHRLSAPMQKYLNQSFVTLRRCKPQKMTPATSGYINALWRFITANMWLEASV
ncbi:MAG: asparagine synthase (glutamine-hydrolyzing) [Verrucomicrobia bacterium RIFCSPHIGHO2_12_FULL_41_10]|nr:MAG: asparagine synthase (glutamine-hydrolyzing) [Verrucomicrobia bacterium RIFCSPHIGHO2_12_FULL_41_10]